MAVPIPSPILESVLKQLKLPIFGRQSSELNWGLRSQLQELQSNLELVGDVLEEVELMGILFPDICRKWVRVLEDVLYEADDLLDEALTRSIPATGKVGQARLTMSNLSFFHVTLPHKLRSRINKKLDEIVDVCCKYNLIIEPTTGTTSSSTSSAAAGTTTAGRNGDQKKVRVARKGIMRYDPENPFIHDVIPIIERRDYHDKVKGMLLDDADNKIVWIIGGPGVGKTTVCRTLYDDEEVKDRFPIKLWVRLDGPDSYIPALKKIATSLSKKEEEPIEMDDDEEEGWLIMKIKRLICGRTFLLVLDNYPPLPLRAPDKQDSEKWIVIPDAFEAKLRSLVTPEESEDHTGSKITGNKILITRLKSNKFNWRCSYKDVSYEIESFSQAEGRRLLFQHTTSGQLPRLAEWQESLGAKIVRNCGGNPALIRCIGTFLKGKDDWASWDELAPSYRYPNKQHYHQIAELYYSFRKSLHFVGYSYLLSRGGLFKYEDLVSQVAANGLPDISKRMEKWFRKAILLKQKSEDLWEEESSYKIIPFLNLDLLDPPLQQGLPTTRFEAIYEPPASSSSSTPPDDHLQDSVLTLSSMTRDSKHLRCFVNLGDDSNVWMPEPELDPFVRRFSRLRVLNLSSAGIKKLPHSISRLSHLRYLDLSRNDFRDLPESICRLKNLQTLRLVYCDKLFKLPRSMDRLARNLKIFRLDMCFHLTGMPPAISRLTGLERLDRFVVSGQRGGLGYLKKLNNLGGRLSLQLPIWWNDATADAGKADLKSKTGITELQVKWSGVGQDVTRDTADGKLNEHYDVLKMLEPNSALKKLSIAYFGGIEFPTWISESHLSQINISKCKRCQNLPPFHKMPNLKSLFLTSMDVEYMQYDHPNPTNFFTSLKEFRIGKMRNLKGWYADWGSGDLPKFPKLDLLEIWECGNLATLPCFSDISELILQDVPEKLFRSIDGRDFEQVRINSIRNLTSLPSQFIGLITETLIVEDCSELKMLGASDQGNKSQNVSRRLKQLKFEGLKDMEALPQGLELLSCLKSLQILNCPATKHISRRLQHLSNLRKLTISKCSEEVFSINGGEDNAMSWEGLEKLKTLEISGFEKLDALPTGLQKLTSLKKLAVVDCRAMKNMSRTLKQLTNLEELEISACSEEVDCFQEDRMPWKELEISACSEQVDWFHIEVEGDGMPWKALRWLDKLVIQGFKELQSLPRSLQNLTSLLELQIIQCPKLKNASETIRHLTCLWYLRLSKCEEVDCLYDRNEMVWKGLTNLSILEIEGCEKLEALPEGLHHPKSLCKLLVTDCKALKNVPKWMAKEMESLYILMIKSCPKFSKEIKQRIKNYSFYKMDFLQTEGSTNDDTPWLPGSRNVETPFYMKKDLEIYYE